MESKLPVIAYLTHSLIGDYHMAQLIAMHEAAQKYGFSLCVFTPFVFYSQKENQLEYLQTFKLLDIDKFDGVIISGASLSVFFSDEKLKDLYTELSKKPLVSITSSYGAGRVVEVNNHKAMYSMVKHFIVDHGYDSFAYIGGPEANDDAKNRKKAFSDCMSDFGIKNYKFYEGDFGFASGQLATRKIVEEKEKVRAIIAANDDMAFGVKHELLKLGFEIPRDFAIAGFDDIDEARSQDLTTIGQGIKEQIDIAVMEILSKINSEKPPLNLEVIPQIIRRGSCGCEALIEIQTHDQMPVSSQFALEKGYSLGLLTTFSKNIMEELSIESLIQNLVTLAKGIVLENFSVVFYPDILSGKNLHNQLPELAERIFYYGKEGFDTSRMSIKTRSLGIDFENLRTHRSSRVISEFIFQSQHYGFFSVEFNRPDAVFIHMINLQISNFIRSIITKSAMESALEKLKSLDQLKNEFIANIAHDFRSPLTIVMGSSELGLFDHPSDDEDQARYQVIQEAALKMKSSVDRFLELTKLENRAMNVYPSEFNLVDFMKGIVEFYSSSLFGTKITLELDIVNASMPAIITDLDKLEQIMHNLFSNALKFVDLETGRIIVRLDYQAPNYLITMVDNGIGIAPDKLEVIFERFSQVQTKESHRGTGIGLAFVKQLLALLGGKIRAHSEGQGTGTSFLMEITQGKLDPKKSRPAMPFKTSERSTQKILIKKELRDRNRTLSLSEQNGTNSSIYKDIKVFIIEDNIDILNIEKDLLLREGFSDIVFETQGDKALDYIMEKFPDIIICDVHLPGLNGDQIYARMAQDSRFDHIPFIFVSALADRQFINDLRRRGALAFLTKPIDTQEFVITIIQHAKSLLHNRELVKNSQIDLLTGLKNRRTLIQELENQFCLRKLRDFTFLFLDLDHFKSINDNYGHQTGDDALRFLGEIVRSHTRPYDISGRYGGEEILIVLPDTNLSAGLLAAEKLRSIIESQSLKKDGNNFQMTVSIGVSSLYEIMGYEDVPTLEACKNLWEPQADSKYDWNLRAIHLKDICKKLIKSADLAMYEAKSEGRNRVKSFHF